jgi:hypothetical protein
MEKRATFDLLAEPIGDLYRELLDFAVGECRTALLVVHKSPPLVRQGLDLLSRLKPFLTSKAESKVWPGTGSPDMADHEFMVSIEPSSVYRYAYGRQCAGLLKQATDRLYAWLQPELPEDLCLLRADGSEWLVTIAHEHVSYLCLSSEEHSRLVKAVPQIGPRLRHMRCREESGPAMRELMGLLAAWNPYDYYGDSWIEADLWPETEAVFYALNSREVRSQAELATYIADMYDRWWGGVDDLGEKNDFTPEICAGVAHTIWAWWEEREGKAASE